jgi:O-methyltransferase involved in polyketide biosynthesis
MHAVAHGTTTPIARCLGVPTLDDMLIARHRCIDARLEASIRTCGVRQVVELASGLSARGLRMLRRFDGLTWIDADLPAMARRKRKRVADAHGHVEGYHVHAVNVLHEGGSLAIERLSEVLDPNVATAVITEGLTMYFGLDTTQGIWRRVRALIESLNAPGAYLSDLYLHADLVGYPAAAWFIGGLERFARGGVHIHFDTPDEVTAALVGAGFDDVFVHVPQDTSDPSAPGGSPLVRVLEARVIGER